MKNPRLPGMEQLKLKTEKCTIPADTVITQEQDGNSRFTKEQLFRQSCPTITLLPEKRCRRRTPFLPITSKRTSRVLNNSDLELSVESLCLSIDENSSVDVTPPLTTNRKSDVAYSTTTRRISLPVTGSLRMRTSHLKSLGFNPAFSDVHLFSGDVTECPADEPVHQMSLKSSDLHSEEYDWMNSRSSTYSSSVSSSLQSSYNSEEEIWLSRKQSV
ncbi:uncharacterized protein LOC106470657 [Limulus polyphemus]|uniref:Uncharacterized protein LOC106470657 n=1 Tax=Limulus polyphemus TaxID=6850 RepID=A0ABM1BQF7_LIMPO|nr:uncharacterized protein LOC106470657 [Limulus polyphemus]